jgi:hypothetical protein
MQWIAIPRTWIDGMMLMRFTPKNPAPEPVALMLVCARIQAGDPMTRRQVADWAGCTAYKARQIIKEASNWMATGGTFDRFSTEYRDENRPGFDRFSTGHPEPLREVTRSDQHGTDEKIDRVSTDNRPFTRVPPIHDSTHTSLDIEGESPSPPVSKKQLEKVVILEMWNTMCAIRADVFPGSQRVLALLPAREKKLRACLNRQNLKPDDLVHLTRWFFTSAETQWVRDKGYHFDTMLRPGNVARYFEKAQGWSPERDQQDIERRLREGF